VVLNGCRAWVPQVALTYCAQRHGCHVHNYTIVEFQLVPPLPMACTWVPRTELLNCEKSCMHMGTTFHIVALRGRHPLNADKSTNVNVAPSKRLQASLCATIIDIEKSQFVVSGVNLKVA